MLHNIINKQGHRLGVRDDISGRNEYFHIVSYKSLGFGALILGIKLLLIIKTFLQMLYISTFSIFLVCIILKYR